MKGRNKTTAQISEKPQETERISCYSASGFLIDVLERNGFFVRSLEFYGSGRKKFRLDVQLIADDEKLQNLLQSLLENQLNLL
ncbi:MAG: hypothetical protein FWD24_01135 [Treponema sp.]|nr:hypothetical protein [Treponema sp.]